MKNFKLYLAFLTMVLFLFSSCSKEDPSTLGDDPGNKGTLTFWTMLNDLVENKTAMKQALSEEIPACSEDAPAYVEIVLTQGENGVVGSFAEPFRVEVNQDPEDVDGDGEPEYFTEESSSLELEPGTYTLQYFTVLNAAEEVIWVAPYDDGDSPLALFVNDPLPLEINLGAGVKKYVDVGVLCFDDRDVNEYGYQFFDIDENEAYMYCFFANYCPNGVHYPAAISVNVWWGDGPNGHLIYSDEVNDIGINDEGDLFASSVCVILPNPKDIPNNEDYLYYEVTVRDWEGAYGDVENSVISGTLSRNDITANFDGEDNVDPLHLRFGCDEDGPQDDCPGDDDCDGTPNEDDDCPGFNDSEDTDEDGVPDECDNCPLDDSNTCDEDEEDGEGEGCETAYMKGDTSFSDMDFTNNKWGWAENWIPGDGDLRLEFWAGAGRNNTSNGDLVGHVEIEVDGEDVTITFDMDDDYDLNEAKIYLRGEEPSGSDNAPGKEADYKGDDRVVNLSVEDINEDGSFWVMVHGDICEDEGDEED